MVEHHVENNLDARLVERLDHLLELVDLGSRCLGGCVPAVRREKGHRVVTPVIGAFRHVAMNIEDRELVDRHQFHGRHPKALQVRDLFNHPEISARMFHSTGLALREASHVHLVDDRVAHGASDVPIPFPVKRIIHQNTFRGPNDAVGGMLEATRQGLGIRIDQSGVAIKPLPGLGIEWPIGLEVIKLSRFDSVQVNAPDISPAIVIAIEVDHFRWFTVLDIFVEEQPHRGCRPAEHGELGAAFRNGRTVG